MESSRKTVQLDNNELKLVREIALSNFIELAPNPRMDSDSFTAFCWLKSAILLLKTKGIDVPIVELKR